MTVQCMNVTRVQDDVLHKNESQSSTNISIEHVDITTYLLTLTSMSLILVDDLRMGRPTSDGKMCAGKLAPLNPHLTNCNNKNQHN